MNTLERLVEFSPAYDLRSSTPGKNYGIHGVDMRMVLKGELGAVQFALYTNWHLPHVEAELDAKKPDAKLPHLLCHPMPADIGYHSPTPRYEGQSVMQDKCGYLDGKPCYYDGSSLQAKEVYEILLRKGGDGVWAELERRYSELFCEVPQ